MQVTAHPTTGTSLTAPAEQETRPVRMLVRTDRRSDYFLPPEDTLRASDLGIARTTTDDELAEMVSAAAALFGPGEDADQVAADWLRWARDGLRTPRDIHDAREWGYHIPVTQHENAQEFSDDPNLRLGWWWVYDLERFETREQRKQRYLSDLRLLDAKGIARAICRSYFTVKDMAFRSENFRMIVNDTDGYRTNAARTIAEHRPDITQAEAEAELLSKARKGLLKALPPPVDRAGQSNLWTVSQAIQSGRDLERLDGWYEYNKVRQTGRPPGSKTKNRRSKAS